MKYEDLKYVLDCGEITSVCVTTYEDYNDRGSNHHVYITDEESKATIKEILKRELSLLKQKRRTEIEKRIEELNNELEQL